MKYNLLQRVLHRWFVVLAVTALVITSVTPALADCPCVTQASGFAGGVGTPSNPYQVCMPSHLDNVRNHLSSNFVQTAHIDMSGFGNFTPIGDNVNHFVGFYDGELKTISNLTVTGASQNNRALFYTVGASGTVGFLIIKVLLPKSC